MLCAKGCSTAQPGNRYQCLTSLEVVQQPKQEHSNGVSGTITNYSSSPHTRSYSTPTIGFVHLHTYLSIYTLDIHTGLLALSLSFYIPPPPPLSLSLSLYHTLFLPLTHTPPPAADLAEQYTVLSEGSNGSHQPTVSQDPLAHIKPTGSSSVELGVPTYILQNVRVCVRDREQVECIYVGRYYICGCN